MEDIRVAVMGVLAEFKLPADVPAVVAGIGASEIAALLADLGRQTMRFAVLANAAPECADWATHCAPAVSVALLAQQE